MNRALLVVDMQNGFCHPEGWFTRIGMGLQGARIQSITAGFNLAETETETEAPPVPVTA